MQIEPVSLPLSGGMTKTLLLPLTLGGRGLGVRKPLPRIGEDTAAVFATFPSATPTR